MLAASLLAAGAAGAYGVTEALKIIGLVPGRSRRFTGSHQEAYFRPEEMPVTQWLFDQVPEVDPETWTLTVKEGSRSTAFSYQDLLAFDDKVRTILDCTGGWYAEQEMAGSDSRETSHRYPNAQRHRGIGHWLPSSIPQARRRTDAAGHLGRGPASLLRSRIPPPAGRSRPPRLLVGEVDCGGPCRR